MTKYNSKTVGWTSFAQRKSFVAVLLLYKNFIVIFLKKTLNSEKSIESKKKLFVLFYIRFLMERNLRFTVFFSTEILV